MFRSPSVHRGDSLEELLGRIQDLASQPGTEDEQVQLMARIREHSPEWSRRLDEFLVGEMREVANTVKDVCRQQKELEAMCRKLTAPPQHAAVYLGAAATGHGPGAVVSYHNAPRVVTLADGVSPARLRPGETVLLGPELNVVVGLLDDPLFNTGETATFDRYTGDGRLIVRCREEETVVRPAGALGNGLRSGDQVRWNRGLGLAFERLPRSEGSDRFMEDTPGDSFADVGGLDDQVARLQRVIRMQVEHPEAVNRYRLRRRTSVLLSGPPGTGKTLVARALAGWLATLSSSGRSRFMNVKPGSLHSMWYAQSEANYREAFRVAREAGARDPDVPVVMFFDEVDAIGMARGGSHHQVDDRVLTAFMTELDGLEARGNILVVAATNRRDALDPALLRPGRLGDLILDIPRPDRAAALEVFARHLHQCLPYSDPGAEARGTLIESAVSRIYAPSGLGELAMLTLRDGSRRPVVAADLVSGAVIASICQAAVEAACLRDVESGVSGVRPEDLLDAIETEFDTAARGLTPANCHRFLERLPGDVDVVKVEPVVRRLRRPHRFLRVA